MPRRRLKRREETVRRREVEHEETVKASAVKCAKDLVIAAQTIELESEDEPITCVTSLWAFIVAGTKDGNVRVYDRDTSGAPLAVFGEHGSNIICLAQLGDDLVASVDKDGQIFTWRPSTTETIGSWKNDDEQSLRAVAKLNEKRLVVGTDQGKLILLSHSSGANLKLENEVDRGLSTGIKSVMVSKNLVVSCTNGGTVDVRKRRTLDCLQSWNCTASNVAVGDKHIVTACPNGRIYVHHMAPPCALDFILEIPRIQLTSVICFDSDICAVADDTGCVSFISFKNKSLVCRVRASYHGLASLAVLSNSRVAVIDSDGGCTLFCPPQQVQRAVNDHIADLFGMGDVGSAKIHPILDAWNAVKQQTLSLIDACESVITTENTARSVGEWCVAHDLLMRAVDTGVVPRSRDYNGTELHWHRELYRHCDRLAIGEKDIGVLISLFREAEEVGVIAEGTSESFVYALYIRKDIEKDVCYSANTIYQLLLRQAETDVRLHQLFLRQNDADVHLQHLCLKQIETDVRLQQVRHYQKVQRITSMINAVLGLIPIGGSIAANAISGGAAILNNLQVCGLVESLLGVGKELSGGFGSYKLVDLFLERGNEVLRADHWNKWGEENRQAVEDAAQNLGLTIEQLRSRLLRAAGMQNEKLESNEEVFELPTEKDTEQLGGQDSSTSEAANDAALVVADAEESKSNVNLQGAQAELVRWASKLLDKSSIEKLGDEESAGCLAAFLINYSKRHVQNYIRLKDALLDVFLNHFIDGSSFVHADERHMEELTQGILPAIAKVAKGLGNRNLEIRLRLFLRHVIES